MTQLDTDKLFSGSIPNLYQTHLVPLLFDPYAADMAKRVAAGNPSRVLEIAAGTGVVTRLLATTLPASASITATDLNQAMLDQAAALGTSRPVEWRQADALALSFPDASFDAVVCQFGVMFFPDKPKAYAEARRVLKPGGMFMFNVWDSLQHNEIADTVTTALATVFPDDPPRFFPRTPYGYFDHAAIERDLRAGGFAGPVRFDTVTARSRAASARGPAVGYVQGTPVRSEIEARDPARLAEATAVAEAALAKRFGGGAVDGKIQAIAVAVAR